MRCKTAQQLISLYIAPQESWLSPEDRQALEAHLAVCGPCRRDAREGREVMGMVQQCWQISADTRALLEKQRYGSSGRIIKLHRTSRRVAAWTVAAACLVVGLLAWRAIVERPARMTRPEGPVASSGEGTPLSIEWAGDGGRIAPGTAVLTSAAQIRTLVINDKHQLTLDAGTKLSIEPLAEAGATGCLVRLAWGRICAQVEHDGHPFVVQTPHGRAVITGTTFDVKTTAVTTTLVVAEGSVRFESEAGAVQVAAGHHSRITAPSSPPSTPALIAWARSGQRTAQVAGILPSDDLLLADLPSPSSRAEVRTDLDEIDYARWIEQKRDWFRQQFPWIFELQEVLAAACPGETLAQAGQMTAELPDYPEILLQIADIGKIACHDGRYYRIPGVADPNALRSMLASKGIDTNENLLGRAFAVQRSPVAAIEDKPTGPDILDGWLTAVKEVATCCRVDKAEVEMLCDYSATACEYLGNTRTLAWLSIKNEKWQVESDERDVALDLLRKIVQKAHDCNEASWRLNIACAASSPEEYTELIRKSIVEVDVLCELESQRTLLGKTLKLQTEE